MLDSVQGRGPGMAFIPYCSLPELEACMKVWEFMEMIHSRSYTHIIKNVYADPSDVFDHILNNDRIVERAKSVTEAYDDFINAAHQYDNLYGVEARLRISPHAQEGRYELKRKLFRAVANVNILEGIRFLRILCLQFCVWRTQTYGGKCKNHLPISRGMRINILLLLRTF